MSNLQQKWLEDSSGPQRSQLTKQKLTLLLFFTLPSLQELPFFFFFSHCYNTVTTSSVNCKQRLSLITDGFIAFRSSGRLNRLSTESYSGGGGGFRQTRLGMTVLSLVGNDEHVGVILGPLHVLPRWTPSYATALVIPSAITKNKKINLRQILEIK